jgi:LPXTG-motif cell wall-anchored protein
LEIDGVIYDPYTITAMDNDSSSLKDGYMQYSITYLDGNNNSYTDYVWVRLPLVEFPEDPTLPGTGDTRSLILGSSVLLLALMGAGALVLSRRKVRQS